AQGRALELNARLRLVAEATREVIRPAIFGVFIITAVYIPILALSGIEGKMFRPMAITVIIALVSAILLSLTFVPAAVALLLRKPPNAQDSRVFGAVKRAYAPALGLAMQRPWAVVAAALLLFVICGSLTTRLGSEFIPNLDEGDIAMHALRIPGTSLGQAIRQQQVLEAKVKELPEVERVFAKIGTAEVATEAAPPSVADNFIILKPRDQWPDPGKSKAQVVRDLEASVSPIPGNRYEFVQPIQMRFNELIAGVRAELAVKVFGDDFNALVQLGQEIGAAVGSVAGAADVAVEQATGLPVISWTPRREVMARLGLTIEELQDFIAGSTAGDVVGQFYEGDRRADIVVRLAEQIRGDVQRLSALPIALKSGGFVPLGEVVQIERSTGLNQVNRESGKRRVVVTANVRGRDLGSFVRDVQVAVNERVDVPAGYWIEYGGTFQQLESAWRRLAIVVPATLLLIATLLYVALGSGRDAAVIFTGIPLALGGGVLALWLRGMPLSITAGVGFIALSGVAVLNGLVMVSFIRQLRDRGASLVDAIREGAATRLRPVLTTALVAALGFVPMAMNTGIGSEVQRPLATVVIGGILSSTALTLLVLPALYLIVSRRSA
ncbi:MAG: CusA/CzcA family heavy metal efflux RND transporter, partial [Steroidobacteraceae bacterium]